MGILSEAQLLHMGRLTLGVFRVYVCIYDIYLYINCLRYPYLFDLVNMSFKEQPRSLYVVMECFLYYTKVLKTAPEDRISLII